MNRKLIFLDIDGTLTSPGSNTPPESAMKAVRLAREKGHKVFLCTGRNPGMLAPVLALGFDGAVASAGGYVFAGDRVLFDCPMEQEDFEAGMARAGAVIVSERKKMTALLREVTEELYQHISGREEEVFQVAYHSTLEEADDPEKTFFRQLRESRENDIRLGITNVGPHRDDLTLTLNGKNIKMLASQGQIRTAALSLKLAQLKVIQRVSGETPVLLLDDVMSELDKARRGRLIQEIRDYQTFITCTDVSDLDWEQRRQIYMVSSSEGKANVSEVTQDQDTRQETEGGLGAFVPPLPVADEGGTNVDQRKAPQNHSYCSVNRCVSCR